MTGTWYVQDGHSLSLHGFRAHSLIGMNHVTEAVLGDVL